MLNKHTEEEFKAVMEKLFTAKWNIPRAVAELGGETNGEDWEEMKKLFSEYCSSRPSIYEPD